MKHNIEQKNSQKKTLLKIFLTWLSKFLPFLAITTVVAIFFYPVWLQNKVPVPGDLIIGGYYPWLDYNWGYPTGVPVKNPIVSDSISFTFPMRELAIDLIKSGEEPLWNPYILTGTPLLANFQSAPFSPTNIFYFFTSFINGWSLQVISQHLFAALFTYFLLRHWNIGKIGAVAGGLVFAFSGFNILWSEWNAHVLAAAFIPLLILLTDRYFKNKGIVNMIALSLVLGLQILSGYPQIVLYSLICIGILSLMYFRFEKRYFTSLLVLFVFSALGFSLAALQIFPAYELIYLSQRNVETIPLKWVFLDWREIISFFAPDYYGNHVTHNYWGFKNYLSNIGFIGTANFIIASLSFRHWRVSKEIKFLFIIAGISLLLAFANPLSVFLWNRNLFGSQAGVAYRCLVLLSISVSLLVGFGVDYWLKGASKITFKNILIPGAILTGFGLYACIVIVAAKYNLNLSFIPSEELWRFFVAFRNLVLPIGVFSCTVLVFWIFSSKSRFKTPAIMLVLVFSIIEVFHFGWKFTPFTKGDLVYPTTPIIDYLQTQTKPFRVNGYDGIMPVNQGMIYKLEFPGGYDAIYPYDIAKFIGVLNSGQYTSNAQDRFGIVDRTNSPLLDLMGTDYFLIKSQSISGLKDSLKPQKREAELVFMDKTIAVVKNSQVLPRAFMVYDWESIPKEKQLENLLGKDFPFKDKILLEKNIEKTKVRGQSKVEYEEYSSQKSLIKVSTTTDGLLFISDNWYPGWKAYVDDIQSEILQADYTFRAIQVPKGNHFVRMVYKPDSFAQGLKISAASLIFLVVLLLFSYRKWVVEKLYLRK